MQRNLETLEEIKSNLILQVQDHAAALPWSLYVLMATEAARQASIEANQVLRIEGFRIHEDYLLSNFASEETVVEFHFNLHRTTTQQKYSFNIQAGLSKRGTEWTELCSGKMNNHRCAAIWSKTDSIRDHELEPTEGASRGGPRWHT